MEALTLSNNHHAPKAVNPPLPLRRSRVVVSQSKRGCVTCKARRVKCDEQKPLCRRCAQAGRLCGGYSRESKSSDLQPALKIGITADSHTERLCYLAAHVLSLDDNGQPLQDDGWGCAFFQLSSQIECVKAAAAAFGAAYESSLNDHVKDHCSTWHYYGSALARLRSDFNNGSVGSESLALASIILAFVEILSQHEQNAFAHFLGAVRLLTKAYQRRQVASSTDILRSFKNALVKMNLSICSYGLSRTPQFMYLESQGVARDDAFCQPELAINAAISCLYQSYQFIQSASELRYTCPSWKEHDPIMCKGQFDAVTRCRSALQGLATLTTRLQARPSATSTLSYSGTLADIYAIRTQLTSALIFIQCIHNPYETGYDECQNLFESIVADAAASARLRRRTKPSAFRRFSICPGIISPLFFVSMKCRDPPLRALATTMLKEQSREGPADGQILAAIGTRLAALETADSVPSSPGAPLAASNVLEEQRVYGYSVPHPRINDEGRRVVDIVFLRPNPPLMQGLGHIDYSCQDDWFYWSETIHI